MLGYDVPALVKDGPDSFGRSLHATMRYQPAYGSETYPTIWDHHVGEEAVDLYEGAPVRQVMVFPGKTSASMVLWSMACTIAATA